MAAPASALHQWPRTKAKTFNAHNKQNRQKKHTTGVKPSPARPYVSTCILCIYWGHTLTHSRTQSHTQGGGGGLHLSLGSGNHMAVHLPKIPELCWFSNRHLRPCTKHKRKKSIHTHRGHRGGCFCVILFFFLLFFKLQTWNCANKVCRCSLPLGSVSESKGQNKSKKQTNKKKSTRNHTQIDICTRDPQTENHETWFACYYLCYLQQEEIQIVIQSNKLKGKWDAARWCHI